MGVYSNRGLVVRIFYLCISLFWSILYFAGNLKETKCIWFCYHGISEKYAHDFDKQIRYLKQLQERNWNYQLHVTFDDGFENLLLNAIPILVKYDIAATVFVVADNLGDKPRWEISRYHPESNERLMSSKEIADINKNKLISIGSHTMTHQKLENLESGEMHDEISRSKLVLEDIIDEQVTELAFPHGSYNNDVLKCCFSSGYQHVYTLDPRVEKLGSRQFAIGRFSMSPDVWPIEFKLTCLGGYSWLQGVRSAKNRIVELLS